MKILYEWIGFFIVSISIIAGLLYVVGWLFEQIGNAIGRKYKALWVIFEFQFYKKDFKEWVKDKERHKNMK